MTDRFSKLRRFVGAIAFTLAVVLVAWLPLGMLHVVPFVLTLPGESDLRVHAAAAVGSQMIVAWGFWGS